LTHKLPAQPAREPVQRREGAASCKKKACRTIQARIVLLITSCCSAYATAPIPLQARRYASVCVCVCAERNSAGRKLRNANALECQRLTPRDGCTAFDVIMFLLYSSIRLQKMPEGQRCTQLSPRRGERCWFDHGQASNREATLCKKITREVAYPKRTQKLPHKKCPFDKPPWSLRDVA